jgi:hypothetical protein
LMAFFAKIEIRWLKQTGSSPPCRTRFSLRV